MRRFLSSLMLALLVVAPAARRLRADSLQDMQAQLDNLDKQLANQQASLDDTSDRVDGLVTSIRKNQYGGSSNPEISGSYGALGKDAWGTGLIDKHGVAFLMKMDLSILVHLDNGGEVDLGFGPAWTPGAFPKWVADDTDEEHKGLGTASRLGTLLGTFKGDFKKGNLDLTGGFMSFQTSLFTLSGPLSDRPILFDKNPYQSNVTSKSYYENQFLTGVPQRSPEESEHYIMGFKGDLKLPRDLSLMSFVGDYEGFYDNQTVPHEYGGVLAWDKTDTLGGRYKLIGYNRSNDVGEITQLSGITTSAFGLMNDTVFSVQAEQKLGPAKMVGEVAHSDYQDNSGDNGIKTQGIAWRYQTDVPYHDQSFHLAAYGISPNYMVIDQIGKYNANGTNLLRYREDPAHPGDYIQQTVVADPSLPINDSTTYAVGGKFRLGSAFLNVNLQNSVQQAPTDARIWASHYEGGGNLNEGAWFVFFNNNYQAWLPPSGTTAAYSNTGTAVNLEREFFYNPSRSGPSGSMPTTFQLNNYDMTYAPLSWSAGAVTSGALPVVAPATNGNGTYIVPSGTWTADKPGGVIPDVNHNLYYSSYHELETNLWRQNYESIVNADRSSGLADAPSVKSISTATGDLRMNLSEFLPMRGRNLFFQVYGSLMTVNDSTMVVPSLDPNNLFVQGIIDSTLVYNLTDDVNMLLNLGIENWVSDRMPTQFMNNDGQLQNGTLEYHDREGGIGLDWNAIPNKLNMYFRVKLIDHEDSFAGQNNFQARQMWWEMKSYF